VRRLELGRPLLLSVGALLAYGLLVLYSAGQTDVPTSAEGAWLRQLAWLGLGVVAAAVVFRISPRVLDWAAPGVYVLALGLLVLTLVIGTGAGTAAASRSWLSLGGFRLGQPSELAKLATILLLARYPSGLREPPDSLRALIRPGLIAGVPFLLVMVQPDLGSAIVFVGILFTLLYWAGVRPFLLLLLASPALSLLLASNTRLWGAWMIFLFIALLVGRPYVAEGIVTYVVNSAMGVLAITLWNRLAPYQQKRLLTFLDPELDPAASGYQAIQSRVAIGSGGWFGNGFTAGPQKRLAFLPEQQTDFIFSVVGEELGFLGVLAALALFFWLFLTLLRIARRATDPFASLVAFGVLGLFLTHVFENVGMTVNVMPITGIPLPFFSYGGSFLIACLLAVGLAFRVAWDARLSGYADI
jgi:rod shape determining protein RodA